MQLNLLKIGSSFCCDPQRSDSEDSAGRAVPVGGGRGAGPFLRSQEEGGRRIIDSDSERGGGASRVAAVGAPWAGRPGSGPAAAAPSNRGSAGAQARPAPK